MCSVTADGHTQRFVVVHGQNPQSVPARPGLVPRCEVSCPSLASVAQLANSKDPHLWKLILTLTQRTFARCSSI
jgi:hypothetical protein